MQYQIDETDAGTFCLVQAGILVFSGIGCLLSTRMLLSIDLFQKVGLGFRSTHHLKKFYIAYLSWVL